MTSIELETVDALLEESLEKKKDHHNDKDSKEKKRSSTKRSRSRSHSRDKRHRKRHRHHSSRRSRSRDKRRSSRSKSREKKRSHSGEAKKQNRTKAKELEREEKRKRDRDERRLREVDDGDRDSRTVFAYNLPLRANERDLFDFFGKAGKVRDVRLISDRNSRKSKGFGYIEFANRECVEKALQLSGTEFMGQTVMVQASQAEKNKVANPNTATAGPTRLYVGSLHYNITEEDIRAVFEPFGDLEFVNLHRDADTGRSKGFAFVQFKNASDAKRALQDVNGLELAGRQLKVGPVNESAKGEGGMLELDDDGGFALNAQSRAMLMHKLQRDDAIAPVPAPISPVSSIPISSVPLSSTCILLKNMFDPNAEEATEPTFESEIQEDVEEECSKYGQVKHCYVEKNTQGFVYIKFATIDAAERACNELNGRWFAGKVITTEYIPEPLYHAKFPHSK